MPRLILASASPIRTSLLSRVRIAHDVRPARIDEDAVTGSLLADGAPPRDVADALADLKARKVAMSEPGAIVLGCDQVGEIDGTPLVCPTDAFAAAAQLRHLSGRTHRLHSAAVIYEGSRPVWRHVASVRMTMRSLSEAFISDYVARNLEAICSSVGGYRIEEEGARLFTRIEGDHFAIQGLPLLDIVSYLTLRGFLET